MPGEELLAQTVLVQQEQSRAGAFAERTRIAREMHDVLAHSLGALSVQLKVAEALLEKGDSGEALERVRQSDRLAAEGLTEARHAVAALRGDVSALPEELRRLVGRHSAHHRGAVTLEVRGAFRQVSPTTTVTLVRLTREALTNAARHAPGEKVSVTVEYGEGVLRLSVLNGLPPAARTDEARVPGYGLTGVRERLAFIGGSLTTGRREDGACWVLAAEVPQ